MPTRSRSSSVRARACAVGQAAVQLQDLADLPLDRVERVERGHRLLEHHGDVVAAHLAHLVLVGGDQVLALEQDAAGRVMRGRVGQELQDRQGRDRLAGAGFADERHRLAGHDVERDAVDREHVAARPGGRRRRGPGRRGGVRSWPSRTVIANVIQPRSASGCSAASSADRRTIRCCNRRRTSGRYVDGVGALVAESCARISAAPAQDRRDRSAGSPDRAACKKPLIDLRPMLRRHP